MSVIQFAIGYKDRFVGVDGLTPADGYHYVKSSAQAVRFNSAEDCATFMTRTGPPWLLEYVEKGTLVMVTLEDGMPKKL